MPPPPPHTQESDPFAFLQTVCASEVWTLSTKNYTTRGLTTAELRPAAGISQRYGGPRGAPPPKFSPVCPLFFGPPNSCKQGQNCPHAHARPLRAPGRSDK